MSPIRLQETGALREDSLYIHRESDQQLCNALLAGEVCSVLAPRQIGKSSLRVRAARMLQKQGVYCAQIDLTTIGKTADRNAITAWYFSVVARIARELQLPDPKPFFEENSALLPVDRFGRYLREQVLPAVAGPVVIFFDEIDYLRVLPIDRDEFFVAIRALYNERADAALLRRLTFCLLGVAAPRDLVRNPDITPFNIGCSISLRDFSRQELTAFAPALSSFGGPVEQWLDEIYGWTSGHPYMTQVLIQQLLRQPESAAADAIPLRVQRAVQRRFLRSGRSSDDNLSYAERRLDQVGQKAELLALYNRILSEGRVVSEENDPVQQELMLCGMVALSSGEEEGRLLQVRNRIFAQVFDTGWLREKEAHRRLVSAVRRWQESGRRDEALLRGEDLAQAEKWASAHAREVTAEEHTFLRSSVGLARREAERERLASDVRTQRRTVIGLAWFATTLLLLLVGLYRQYVRTQEHAEGERQAAREAQLQSRRASAERDRAEAAAVEAQQQRDRAERAAQAESAARKDAQGALRAEAAARREAVAAERRARGAAAAERVATQRAEQDRREAEKAAATARLAASAEREAKQQIEQAARQAEDAQRAAVAAALRAGEAEREAMAAARTERSLRAAALAEHPEQRVRALVEAMRTVLPVKESALGPVWEGISRVLESSTLSAVLEGHVKEVRSASFSPDGLRLVSASFDQTARIWDLTTGEILFHLIGHAGSVRSASYSPDGRLIATTGDDMTLRLWEAETGRARSVLHGHRGWVLSGHFSADGSLFVTSGFDRKIILWDLARGRRHLTLERVEATSLSAEFSPDRKHVVAAGEDGVVRIFDAQTGSLVRRLEGHEDSVRSATYSPDGRYILSVSRDKSARIWDAQSGALRRSLTGHSAPIRYGAYSRDGLSIATASEDHTVEILDAESGALLSTLTGHSGPLWSVDFSPDGTRLATASEDGTIRIWNVQTGRLNIALRGHKGRVEWGEYSPNGRWVVTAGEDRTVRLWNAATGHQERAIDAHEEAVTTVSFSPQGDLLVTGGVDRLARIWDARTGRPVQSTDWHPDLIRSARFSPTGTSIATVGDDGVVRIWDARDPLMRDQRTWLGVTVQAEAVQARTVIHATAPQDALPARLYAVAYSPDGARIATGGTDSLVRVWSASSGRLLQVLRGHTDSVSSLAYDHTGQYILSGSEDRTARIWDTAAGALKVCLSGHTGPVWSAAFSPDGYYVVTASQDQTARIWDATKGRVLLLLQGHRTSISSAAFAPDSRSVLTTGADGTALLHPIDPGAMYRFGCRLLQALRRHPDAPADELRPLLASCAT